MAFFETAVDMFKRFTGTKGPLRRAMDPIINNLGLQLLDGDDEAVLLLVLWGGEEYRVFVGTVDGVTARVSAQSQHRFPPNRLPPEVCQALDEMNTHLPVCEYDALHTHDYSQFVVRTQVNIAALMAPFFGRTLRVLMEPLQNLDDTLLRRGYVN